MDYSPEISDLRRNLRLMGQRVPLKWPGLDQLLHVLCQRLVEAASARAVDALPPEPRPHREGFWAPVRHGLGPRRQAGEEPPLQRRARFVACAHEVHDQHFWRPEPEAPGCEPHRWDFMCGQHGL